MAASGAPVISGTVQVEESLTADTTGIQDDNGLNRVQYRFQWLSNDGSTDTNIAGATDSTYTLVAADEGKTIKVRVSFTDRGGYAESLTSTSTEEVTSSSQPEPAPTPEPTPELPEGTVTGLTLSSDAPGSLTIEWNTPSPSPSDYRVNWARAGQGWLSWRFPNEESRGNEYPAGSTTSLTLTGLTEGAEFRVKMRARYSTGPGPWTDTVTQQVLEQPPQATSTVTSTVQATSTLQATSTATSTVQATGTVEALTDQERTYVELSGGSFHTCGITTGGSVHCWGEGHRGQTGSPAGVYKALASGSAHTCAIATDGSISCLGWDTWGQASPPAGTFKSIESHSRHSCAIAVDDTIACWGYHSFYQNASPAGTYKSMAIGWEHTCTIKTDDTVSCWGLNDKGQGNLPSGTYKAITAGFVHTCTIATDNTISCWGYGGNGQTRAPSGTYQSISAKRDHTCAIATDDTVSCWGLNQNGQTDAPRGTYKAVATAGETTGTARPTDLPEPTRV